MNYYAPSRHARETRHLSVVQGGLSLPILAVCHAVAAEEVFMQGEADKVFMTIALDEARQV